MTHVEGFDSLDAMFAAMAASEDIANASLTPGQVRLRDDVENTRYWARPMPDWDLILYGVAQPSHVVARSASFDVKDNRERGYLTGTVYSGDDGYGEYGDTHVSEVVPIPPSLWALAQAAEWPRWSDLHTPEHAALGRLLAKAEQAALRD
jgi:hypothetical protein